MIRYPKTYAALREVGIDPSLVPEGGFDDLGYLRIARPGERLPDGARLLPTASDESVPIARCPWPFVNAGLTVLAAWNEEWPTGGLQDYAKEDNA